MSEAAPARFSWIYRLHVAAGGFAADVGFYALSATFAGITGLTATLAPHRAWGRVAVIGYAIATLVALAQGATRSRHPLFAGTRARALLASLTFLATAVVPLLIQATQRAGGRVGRAQEEVGVVESGGLRLWHTGTPYLSHDAIKALPMPAWLDAYMPYQPGMAVFGLPRAIIGVEWWTDARVWFLLVFATSTAGALALTRKSPGPARVRAVQACAVFPVCALTLAVGGDDMPVLGLCLAALALASRGRFGASGVAVGAAGALKLFAWPVALVLLAFAVTNRRAAFRFAVGAIGLPMAVMIPAFAVDGGAAFENVVRFPLLGSDLVASPAASPFPGHLIAAYVPAGHAVATALLAAAAVAIGITLVRRPPETASRVAMVSAGGLLAAIMLISATRFGYLLYPVAYACWALVLRPDPASPAAYPAARRGRSEITSAISRPSLSPSAVPSSAATGESCAADG